MTEFGRGHSGGRENNYNYTNSLQNIIYLLMQGATQPPKSIEGRTFLFKNIHNTINQK